MEIRNPILPGFYPDPSICRVGEDYYLVNSSFSYFPGIPIFHSRDLANWEQIGHVLDRPSQLDITHQGISDGVWAPAIRFHDGVFYIVNTCMGGIGNFFVTATDPAGPWSEPHLLPEIEGIDPSFFFDEDGKAYIVNNGPPPDHRAEYDGHCALWLQEFDVASQALIGPRKIILNYGSDPAKQPIWIEGPHLFSKDGFYYLLAAEGGTYSGHSEVIFRSQSIWGPYESFSGNPVLTQRDLSDDRPSPVTSTGHADMVQLPDGRWVAVFLGCQPYEGEHYNTGRQTFLVPVDWGGDWPLILPTGTAVPETLPLILPLEADKAAFSARSEDWIDRFNGPTLKPDWNFIRTPREDWLRFAEGWLEMDARPVSIKEKGNPSFIGRRLQHSRAEFSTSIQLETGRAMEAGLVAFQNEKAFYKWVVKQSGGGLSLSLSSAAAEIERVELKALTGQRLFLKIQNCDAEVRCAYSVNGEDWTFSDSILDGRILSTISAGGFVGVYLGLYAYAESPAKAWFDWARYRRIH
jgi:alpha-N-arabinofuranosidase